MLACILSNPKPSGRVQGEAAPVQSEAARAMIYLVSPDCVLYVINDTDPNGPDVQQLRQLRNPAVCCVAWHARGPDPHPCKNFNQLSGWTTGPHDGRGKAGNWQHLDDVKWIEDASGDLFPLVGSAQNAMKIFIARGLGQATSWTRASASF